MPAVHHLALRTADVSALADFYRHMFEFEVVRDERPRTLWLALGTGAVLMIEARTSGETACAPGSLDLIAFRVDGASGAAVAARARALGCYDGETSFTVYLRDPDGRRIGASSYDFGA